MTFTYNLTTVNDITRVRYEIADTVESTAMFADEEISFVLAEKGSVQTAVISLLRRKIAELANQDDFKADWLSVDNSNKLAALEKLLQQKLNEYGINSGSTGVVHRYRADSAQHEEPDYDAPDYDAYGSAFDDY